MMKRSFPLLQRMLILSERDVRSCLPMADCIEANRRALIALATGEARVPSRLGLQYFGQGESTAAAADWSLFKPAALDRITRSRDMGDVHRSSMSHDHSHAHGHHHSVAESVEERETQLMGIKLVSLRAQNPVKRGLPLVPATVLVVNADTGVVDAVVSGTYLTAARTAAGSALASSLVKPRGFGNVVVFGAGLQAYTHLQALSCVLGQKPIPQVTIINRSLPKAQELAHTAVKEGFASSCSVLPLSEKDSPDPDHHKLQIAEVLSTADVVVTCTNSTTPVFNATQANLLPSGCHVNGIGSYTPEMQEVPGRFVDRCHVIIDTPDARNSVGDLHTLTANHPVTLLGELLSASDPLSQLLQGQAYYAGDSQRQSGIFDCTFYKAVGTAIQDIVTADLVVKRARDLGIGAEVNMD
jgi:ornithine cyclodeaminase